VVDKEVEVLVNMVKEKIRMIWCYVLMMREKGMKDGLRFVDEKLDELYWKELKRRFEMKR